MSLSADLLKQVHLSGESGCGKFQPHPMKANFCTGCSKLFNKHSPNSIASDDMLIAVSVMCGLRVGEAWQEFYSPQQTEIMALYLYVAL